MTLAEAAKLTPSFGKNFSSWPATLSHLIIEGKREPKKSSGSDKQGMLGGAAGTEMGTGEVVP